MTVAEFEAAGLYDPAAPGAADRLALLEWLVAQGATLEQMVEAQRHGSLTGLAGDLILRPGERLTLAEVAAAARMEPSRIERLRLATGLPPAGADEKLFTREDGEVFANFATGDVFFGERPMVQFIRVIGASLARIAEAAVALFLANVQRPIVERHAGELALAEANLRAIQALEAIPHGVRTILRAHMETAIRRLRAARREELMPDTVQVTVGFVDLVGYTRLSGQLDARALGTLVERFEAFASDTVAARDGRVVKLIGDEVMFVAVDAAAACDIALTLVERFAVDPSVTPRGGLALGSVLMRSGDYYGPVVNLASRIADLAVPREVLVTADVVEHVGTDRFRFEPAGRRALKGFYDPVALHTAARA